MLFFDVYPAVNRFLGTSWGWVFCGKIPQMYHVKIQQKWRFLTSSSSGVIFFGLSLPKKRDFPKTTPGIHGGWGWPDRTHDILSYTRRLAWKKLGFFNSLLFSILYPAVSSTVYPAVSSNPGRSLVSLVFWNHFFPFLEPKKSCNFRHFLPYIDFFWVSHTIVWWISSLSFLI